MNTKKSIQNKMFFSMFLSLMLMFALLVGAIFFGGITEQLHKNAFDILDERVSGRRNNLENEMVRRWSSLNESLQDINQQTKELLAANNADYTDLTEDCPLSSQLLESVSERLIYQLRRSSVTGIFMVLNGDDSEEVPVGGKVQRKSGVYLRDYDPDTSPADDSDFMLERAPMEFVKNQKITLDTYWQPLFTFGDGEENDYYYKPYQAALASPEAEAENLGYWSPPMRLDPNGATSITYSLPLLSDEGIPYGVLGVEMTLDYMAKKLPYTEINGTVQGSYVLAKNDGESDEFEPLLSAGPYFRSLFGSECKSISILPDSIHGDSHQIAECKVQKVYGCVKYLNLYNRNTPFENERWALIGVIQDDNLLGFYHQIVRFLVLTLMIAFAIGTASAALNSVRLARPITQLAKKVRESNPNRPVLLEEIGVTEIDELSASIETLSHSVAESYSTLSKIMMLAGYEVGAFEYVTATKQVQYTDAFFHVLGLASPADDYGVLSVAEFKQLMKPVASYSFEVEAGGTVYQISTGESDAWVRMQVVDNSDKILGVVSDVTAEILQRKKLEYERDYDSLTMLQNRRAFHQQVSEMLDSGEVHIAAMIMMDLDNLKYINDTYGHDVGDRYLRAAADVLQNHTDHRVLTARMSGDEFYVFILGDNREEIEEKIAAIKQDLSNARMDLPDATKTRVRVSAGIAWYPRDSDMFSQLIRYADFAMYRVKHTTKGRFSEFNQDNYDRESFLLNNKEELNHLIDDCMVRYEFQVIVDAHDGSAFAYEALMRPTSPLFTSPLDVLAVAHSQSKLYEIERLTMFKALEEFARLSPRDAPEKLFLNSIPNQMLGPADIAVLENTYAPYLSRIVVELTEEEKPDGHLVRAKNVIVRQWNAQIALDDFGAGYNGETTLLTVAPDYIKIDQTIVRNLNRDSNRRQIVENIINYANHYRINVIGEGVESFEEMEALISCGVHYLQGYYLGYPNGELVKVSEKVRGEIQMLNAKKQKEKIKDENTDF